MGLGNKDHKTTSRDVPITPMDINNMSLMRLH